MINEFCLELNSYLQHKYSLKRPPAYYNLNNTINARRSKFDLYLRYKQENRKTLVIARIGFKEQKKGNGTMFLKFLSEIADRYDIEKVSLECVNENSYNFGIKMGFADIGNTAMEISTDDLVRNIDKINATQA
jgi:hypothetical protein